MQGGCGFQVINSIQCESSGLQSKNGHGDLCTPETISEKTQTAHAQFKVALNYPFLCIFRIFKQAMFNDVRSATTLPKRYTIALKVKK